MKPAPNFSVIGHGTTSLSVTSGDRDRALVDGYIGGDSEAFAAIFNDHYEALLSQAHRLLGTFGQPEDACQETFRRALQGIRHFGSTGEYRVGAWLNTILHHVCIDERARIGRERALAQALYFQHQDEVDLAEQVPEPGHVRAVDAAIRQLRPELRRALLLREIHGWSYAQVAVAEHISEDNARTRAYRARRFVQRQLPASVLPPRTSARRESNSKRVA